MKKIQAVKVHTLTMNHPVQIQVALRMANWRCLGIDISAKQLDMARSGARELAVSDRVEYREQPIAAFEFATTVWLLI